MVVVLLSGYWCFQSFTAQINNSIRLDFYARELQELKEDDGRYPPSFSRQDYFGREVLYRATPEHFILVSFGKDGRPDANYDDWLANPPSERASNCMSPNADTVFLESGPVVFCLK